MPRRTFLRRASLILILLATWSVFVGFSHATTKLPKEEDQPVFDHFPELQGEDWVKAHRDAAQKHFEAWKTARGKKRDKEGAEASYHAWRSEQPGIINEILADGHLAEMEVKPPQEETTVRVEVKLAVPDEKVQIYSPTPIWRRITPGAFELWTPWQGWLLNAKGDLVRQVEVKRDVAHSENEMAPVGREWFGAFLPDGHWITTELHEGDGRVYIFDKHDHCTHEIRSGALLKDWSQRAKAATMYMRIIPWARSDKTGERWLVRIGSEEGEGEALLEPDGTWRRVGRQESLWTLCQRRQLGVRLFEGICGDTVGSDDGRLALHSYQPGHGEGVGNPCYTLQTGGQSRADSYKGEDGDVIQSVGNVPGRGNEFGFWPGSHGMWIQGDDRTWFFDKASKYQGWIAGFRAGDAADGQGLLFRLKDGRCITVSQKMRATEMQRFVLPDGRTLLPLELHPDLGMGVFAAGRTKEEDPGQGDEPATLHTNDEVLFGHLHIYVARWAAAARKKR